MAEPAAQTGGAAHARLLDDVLAGRRKGIARAMSIAEGAVSSGGRDLLAQIHRATGRAHVIGITGVPGSGKSTLVRALAQGLRAAGRSVGIVAIDPSSPFSGGAILGDRIRMLELTGDPGVFIRSLATRGALGGLARATHDVVDVLDAGGFEVIIIETVGVGQDEVDIVQAAHTVIVVSAPGLGDQVQAIKAGVLEIADIHAVSKCDRADAPETIANLRTMVRLGGLGRDPTSWKVPVVGASAQKREGIDDLIEAIDAHGRHLADTGERMQRQRRILEMRILKTAEDLIRDRLLRRSRGLFEDLLEQAVRRELDPVAAAETLLGRVGELA